MMPNSDHSRLLDVVVYKRWRFGYVVAYRARGAGGGGGEGYILVTGLWGCAAGWGRIFMTGLLLRGCIFRRVTRIHFQDFGGQKIQVCRALKIERFTPQ